MTELLNARAEVWRENEEARILRIYPAGIKTRCTPGQYGSLGLPSDKDPQKLVKRAYSLSCSLVDPAGGRVVDLNEVPYYEFFFNRVRAPKDGRERLVPKLFKLKSGDAVHCGRKIVGYYTLDRVPREKDILLIASTTGEAANNSLAARFFGEERPGRVCNVTAGPRGWTSLYEPEHGFLSRRQARYRRLTLEAEGDYGELEALVSRCCQDRVFSEKTLGFALKPDSSSVFLVGDPAMTGAPQKLGAWAVDIPPAGLIRVLKNSGFELTTKFRQGNLEYENYW